MRLAASEERAAEWALVLEAAAIPHRLERGEAGWLLAVGAGDAARAAAALDGFDAEALGEGTGPGLPPDLGGGWIGPVGALLLLAFFAVTGPRDGGAAWFARGSADAEALLSGEGWRAITALTLHADLAHALGNAAACVVFVGALGQRLGAGRALWLVLLVGAAGNALTAVAYGARHDSVGASTALFGALGLLGGLEVVRRRRAPRSGRPWAAGAAALALFGLLGVGDRSDVVAHLAGLVLGGLAGVGAAWRGPGRRRPALDGLLAAGALAAVAACWAAAGAAPRP